MVYIYIRGGRWKARIRISVCMFVYVSVSIKMHATHFAHI